jgi:NADPH2:quinone reductase
MEIRAVGLNFIDTYHRSGLYPCPCPPPSAARPQASWWPWVTASPACPGRPGGPLRRHARRLRHRPPPARRELFDLPPDIDFVTAAAVLLKGCTTEFLAERAATLIAGDHALVHAAAGGVGQLLVQWLSTNGINVIATAGSEAKLDIALQCGATHAFLTHDPDLVAKVRAVTGGGVPVIYDAWARPHGTSRSNARRRGLIVSYGNASGAVTGVALGQLTAHGSLFVTRPTMGDYYTTPEERAAGISRVWAMLRSGNVKVTVGQTFALAMWPRRTGRSRLGRRWGLRCWWLEGVKKMRGVTPSRSHFVSRRSVGGARS